MVAPIYTIDPNTDTTSEAISKHISEIERIFSFLEGARKFWYGDAAPQNPEKGWIWLDSTNKQIKLYDGSAWKIIPLHTRIGATADISKIQSKHLHLDMTNKNLVYQTKNGDTVSANNLFENTTIPTANTIVKLKSDGTLDEDWLSRFNQINILNSTWTSSNKLILYPGDVGMAYFGGQSTVQQNLYVDMSPRPALYRWHLASQADNSVVALYPNAQSSYSLGTFGRTWQGDDSTVSVSNINAFWNYFALTYPAGVGIGSGLIYLKSDNTVLFQMQCGTDVTSSRSMTQLSQHGNFDWSTLGQITFQTSFNGYCLFILERIM